MGHIRLGELPRTGYWRDVIKTLGLTDDPSAIASVTARAAHKGLDLAKADQGVANAIYILMKTVWSSKEKDFKKSMSEIGINVSARSGLLDVVGEVDRILDIKLHQAGHRTDLAEMARFSAVETLIDISKKNSATLFDTTVDDTQKALKSYATAKRFEEVGKSFFGKFLYRFLDYHVSREAAKYIGKEKPHKDLGAYSQFKERMERHCIETVRVIQEFGGCWPSATEFKSGITAETVRTKFVPIAFKKIQSELAMR